MTEIDALIDLPRLEGVSTGAVCLELCRIAYVADDGRSGRLPAVAIDGRNGGGG